MTSYQQYRDDFNARLRSKLRGMFGDRVDLKFDTRDQTTTGDVTITNPETGFEVRLYPAGRDLAMPLSRMVVALARSLPGGIGEMRKEIRSANRDTEVNLDRVVDHVVEIMDLAGPLYYLRRAVKTLVWPLFGLDPREVENYRTVQYMGRDLALAIQWDSHWKAGRDQCCVKVLLREVVGSPYGQRKLEWCIGVGEPLFVDQLRQQVQAEVEKWDQADLAARESSARKQSNEAISTRLRKQYRDVDQCSIEANPDNFRLTVWLTTEEDTEALLKWLQARRGRATEPQGQCFHCEREVPLSSGIVLDNGKFFCCGDCALPYRV